MPSTIKNLVIGGGGTAGYCYIGALRELFGSDDSDDKPKLSDVKNFIGTSAGSIMATILSCTSNQEYLMEKFAQFDVSKLQDDSYGMMMDLYRLYYKFGYNKGEYALNVMREIMGELTGNPKITFAEHYEKTKHNLVITGSNTTTKQIVYFNRLTHPNMEVALAVRASMSIPLMFVPITYQTEKFQNILGTKAIYVDGGLLDNYPFHLVLSDLFELLDGDADVTDEQIEAALFELYSVRDDESDDTEHSDADEDRREKIIAETIGIKSYNTDSLSAIDPMTNQLINHSQSSVKDFTLGIVGMLMDYTLKLHINSDIWERTVKIDIGTISTTNFDIDQEDIENMLDIGKKCGIAFNASLTDN